MYLRNKEKTINNVSSWVTKTQTRTTCNKRLKEEKQLHEKHVKNKNTWKEKHVRFKLFFVRFESFIFLPWQRGEMTNFDFLRRNKARMFYRLFVTILTGLISHIFAPWFTSQTTWSESEMTARRQVAVLWVVTVARGLYWPVISPLFIYLFILSESQRLKWILALHVVLSAASNRRTLALTCSKLWWQTVSQDWVANLRLHFIG